MKWFAGSIAEAISFAQREKIVFVAFVEGSCEKSKTMASTIDDTDVIMELEKSSFICVKLEGHSIGYKQLAEIYRNIPIPSLFFISHYGQPLDIVDGNIFTEFSDVKKAVVEAAEYSVNMNAVQQPPKPGDKLLDERRQQVDEILETKRKKFENSSAKSVKKTSDGASSSGTIIKPDPENNTKKSEESELKKIADERQEEVQARQKILSQIAQDKAERAAKLKTMAESKPSMPANKEERPVFSPSSDARIQFKLPTGESKSNMFPKLTKLIEIRRYIDSNLELTYRDYKLATTFPRREFTAEDNESTLEDLNLVPTAVLLILPKSGGRLNPVSGNWLRTVSEMVQDFLQPLYSLANYVHGMLFRRRGGEGGAATQPAPSTTNQKTQPRTTVRKSGNIHSLKDLRDGNDENNTWNGNSTQQM